MKRLIGFVMLAALACAVGGCQWATFREAWTRTPTRLEKSGEGRTETRTATQTRVEYRSWRAEDGTLFIQPVITADHLEVPNHE